MNTEILFIPRVLFNTTEKQIKDIFNRLNIGIIDHIDLIPKNDEKNQKNKSKRVYIHLKKWLDTENAKITKERFGNNQDIKVIYDEPWFWKVSAYKKPQK
jgi:hypothetical protein